ncbi:MAG: ATP-binding protein, partial [Actinomycetota bacterium]|nr:ATP-binding protein [Actinomycetota bacterium]
MAGTITERLLEREAELALLRDTLGRAASGAGGVVLIEGPPGVGKTRLLEAARADALTAGMRVLHARATELEAEFAFGVVRQLVDPVLRGSSDEELG